MQPTYRQRKGLGITLSSAIIFAVVFVTFYFEWRTPAVIAPTSDPSTTAQNSSVPAPVAVQSPMPVKIVKIPTTTASVQTPPPADVPKQTASVYRDGTYSATGSYMSPGGQEQIAVTLTLANDIVTSVSVTPQAYDRTSSRYQSRFVSGYKQYVIGKNVADVNLGAISGSSLTPIGFNDAIAQIKAQAKA